jgi:pimeloyl-ACP methyl ester carboxylesterase
VTGAIGVYVREADDALVELAIASGLPVVAIGDGPAARSLRQLSTADRRVLVVGVDLSESEMVLVDSAEEARVALAGGAELVLFDLRAGIGALLGSLAAGPARGAMPSQPDSRQPLVLLSGMLGDATVWDDVALRLNDIALPWPVRIDLDDCVPELAATALAGAPEAFALAGHSLGAIVALEMMRQAPHRVRRLALVAASARGPSEVQLAAWRELRERTEAGGFVTVAEELARTTAGSHAQTAPTMVAANLAMAHRVGAEGLLRQLAAQSSRPDSRGALAAIAVPTIVVSGTEDLVCPPALQEELAAGISGARLASLSGVGHMIPLEAPELLAAELRQWLAQDQ